ncbi:hypothetical protein GDO81_014672 [Engystomops pustulosus]|uniref:Uncharacterized protein n=2 Tax=Engystomops pustulosus TaxID=76066 RepID=A0AAV7BC46_ENGPU|nr:hypothetical protein GDO81_014672 [Engystomops pustulosus]KAG8570060.1 hypothetical protein GDO81_014672 [Engystomops pustulosus]
MESSVGSQWQQFWFYMMDGSLFNQTLAIKYMRGHSSEDCTFRFDSLPIFHNCSGSRLLAFAKNKTHIETLTNVLSLRSEDLTLQHGSGWNGYDLPATRGGLLSEESVMNKISEYLKYVNSSTPALAGGDNNHQGWIIAAVVVFVLAFIFLAVLFIFYLRGKKKQRRLREVHSYLNGCDTDKNPNRYTMDVSNTANDNAANSAIDKASDTDTKPDVNTKLLSPPANNGQLLDDEESQ